MDGESLAEVIAGAKRGDAGAFDTLVDEYGGRVYGFVFRLTGSRHDAEDLVQEVFLRLVRTIARYEHDGRFEAWIFRIAANLVRDRVRKVRRTPTQESGDRDWSGGEGESSTRFGDTPSDTPASDASLSHREDVERLNEAMARLPDGEREVILLRHFSQLSFKEIAELMQTPLGTALARAHRGLARLREMMTGPEAAESGESGERRTAGVSK